MARSIGELSNEIVGRLAARRQSTDRWFMDRDGTVHINKASARAKPITDAEWEAIDAAVREFASTSHEVH